MDLNEMWRDKVTSFAKLLKGVRLIVYLKNNNHINS